MHLSTANDIVSTKIYDKRDDFDFEIVNFPLEMMMFLALHPKESISLNSFVLLVADFNTCNKLLTQKLLKLKSLLRQRLSEPDFYGDLVYKLKKIVGSNNFSGQFIKIIFHYKKIGYNINVLQPTACLVVNLITVGNFAFLFNCMPVGRTSDSRI